MPRLTLLVPIALAAVACGGCRGSSDRESEPLATSSSGPIAFLRAERPKRDPPPVVGIPHKLVVIDSDGSNERTIRTPGYDVESFSWSPDGRRLVFAAWRRVVSAHGQNVQYSIFVANADGTGVRKIRPIPSYFSNPTWSPRGDLILFNEQNEQDDASSAVWVMKPDGSGARKLTPGYDFLPSGWSPDGGKIMYQGLVPSNNGDYLMNPDGSGKRKVTRFFSDLDGGSLGGGEWTPLGIAYWDAGGIGFVKPDGRRGKIEIQVGDEWQRVGFSPDGRTVALEGPIVPIGDWEIALVRIGGDGLQKLTDNDRQDVNPAFSPDGKSLAFEVVPIVKGAIRPQRDIYLINADGSGERNLTDSAAADESEPAWAPKN